MASTIERRLTALEDALKAETAGCTCKGLTVRVIYGGDSDDEELAVECPAHGPVLVLNVRFGREPGRSLHGHDR